MAKIYQGDVGTIFEMTVGTDLSAATLTQYKIKRPDDTTVTRTASVKGSPTDGILTYTGIADDTAQVGKHYLQAYVEFPTWTGLGETVPFEVHEPYDGN